MYSRRIEAVRLANQPCRETLPCLSVPSRPVQFIRAPAGTAISCSRSHSSSPLSLPCGCSA